MIFISDAQGNILNVLPSTVNQNSNLASRIILIAPFSKTVQVSVAFTLPNGSSTTPSLMGSNGLASAEFGENYGVWTYDTPQVVTALKGRATVQFFIHNGTQTISTTAQSFEIYSGVDYIEPELTDSAYDEILNAISLLGANIESLEIKTDFLVKNGNGNNFLADDGTYKEVPIPQSVTDSIASLVKNVEAVDNQLTEKVDKSQVATVNGQSLLEGGNIEITGGSGGGSVEVDAELSTESENPVQNKVVTEALNDKVVKNKVIDTYDKIYGQKAKTGEETVFKTSISPASSNLVKYDSTNAIYGDNGNLIERSYAGVPNVGVPLKPGHATPKKWVEDLVDANKGTKLYKHTIQFSINWTSTVSGSQYTGDFTVECLSTSNTKVVGINNDTWFNLPLDAVIVEGSGNVYEFHKNSATMSFYTIDNQEYKKQDWEIWRDKQDDWPINNNQGKTISLVFVASAVTPM